MRRLLLLALLVAGVVPQPALSAGSQGVQGNVAQIAKTVFVGWVDISPNDWVTLRYSTKEEWLEVITWGNDTFQRTVEGALPTWKLTGAKDRTDNKADGYDLAVTFSGVRFDFQTFHLYATIHLTDPKTGADLAVLLPPKNGYEGGRFSVANCLEADLKQLAMTVGKEVRRLDAPGKR